jgi:hypothetical protein
MIIFLICIVALGLGTVVYLLLQTQDDTANSNTKEPLKGSTMPIQEHSNKPKITFNCPSCGAEVGFQSNLSLYGVCKYCRSMIVRHDVNVESIGTMANLPEDMSPIQIGMEGSYQGNRFFIIGRMKIGWEDGSWNEWFITSTDGRRGWLAEAQGFYAISFEDKDALQLLNTQSVPNLGSYLELNHKRLKIVDIKKATCIGSEGELPFSAPQGRETTSIDLLGPSREFGSIEIEGSQWRVYTGNYVEWDELHCQNFRSLENW